MNIADHVFNPWRGQKQGIFRRRSTEANWRGPLRWNYRLNKRCPGCGAVFDWKECEPDQCLVCETCDMFADDIRPRIFCASLADWLDDEVPIEWLADLLDLIRLTPNLDWLLLSKRPEDFFARLGAASNWCDLNGKQEAASWINWWTDTATGGPPENVWIGTSVEHQEAADTRIPHLLKIPARVRFLSCEPLLGKVHLPLFSHRFCAECRGTHWVGDNGPGQRGNDEYAPCDEPPASGIHWVIVGGESGKHARPMHPDWARSLRDQCAAARVPFLFKQWGEWTQRCLLTIDGKPYGGSQDFAKIDPNCDKWPHSIRMCRCGGDARTDAGILPMCQCESDETLYVQKVGKKAAGRLLDGVEHNEFPEVKP